VFFGAKMNNLNTERTNYNTKQCRDSKNSIFSITKEDLSARKSKETQQATSRDHSIDPRPEKTPRNSKDSIPQSQRPPTTDPDPSKKASSPSDPLSIGEILQALASTCTKKIKSQDENSNHKKTRQRPSIQRSDDPAVQEKPMHNSECELSRLQKIFADLLNEEKSEFQTLKDDSCLQKLETLENQILTVKGDTFAAKLEENILIDRQRAKISVREAKKIEN
jgi:hypothetical protein